MKYKKKLIEVALPLEAINTASAKEKSIRSGHPSTLHLWWARRPLASARAVIFAQMVDDPSEHPDIFETEKSQEKERQRLFKIIEELVKWENNSNEPLLKKAQEEIWQSWRYTCAENSDSPKAKQIFDRYKLPSFHDPFAGGGALPLEAQRLGLDSFASDLNPVAILINKGMIEIPPIFSSKPPVNKDVFKKQDLLEGDWKNAKGLANDVRFYGGWIRDEAEKRLEPLYPKVSITSAMVSERPDLAPYIDKKLNVIAWLWARTVKSSNPAFANIHVPLTSTFMLSTKAGKEAYVEPIINGESYVFKVRVGKPKDLAKTKSGTKLARGANFYCLLSDAPMSNEYVRNEFKARRNGDRLMAIVAEGDRGRVYLSPTTEQESIAKDVIPGWIPEQEMNQDSSNLVSGRGYGITHWSDIFTKRQLAALSIFSELISDVKSIIIKDAISAGLKAEQVGINQGGSGALAYAEAVSLYLAFAVDKMTDRNSSVCGWDSSRDSIRGVFGRQAIPMVWDFAESNPIGGSAGSYENAIDQCYRVLNDLPGLGFGKAEQADAATQNISINKVISTDPPYYDNIAYADLSDFFYIWLRNSLKPVFPELFSTLTVPKSEELVATPYRHGGAEKAEKFFLDGMTNAMHRIAEQAHEAFPVTIYYAFKQSETDSDDGTINTGWDTFLAAVIKAGFSISGTWPMRTELSNRMIGSGTNALASSIVLVCRRIPEDAGIATRRDFIATLKEELPTALRHLQAGNIAPVDLAQAAIGPGMAVYTRYSKVIDAEGNPMSVRTALALINQTLDEALAEQEGDFDSDSRWALTWFDQNGFNESDYGLAEQLSVARNTSVEGLEAGGIVLSKAGKVRLLRPEELSEGWNPLIDKRITAWEIVHQLIRALEIDGEGATAKLVANLGSHAEIARELCYRLYALCERKKRTNEAMSYNGLVQSWPEIIRLSRETSSVPKSVDHDLFDQE